MRAAAAKATSKINAGSPPFHVKIQRSPGPLNVSTFLATSSIIHDDRHPLHSVFKRRLEDYNTDRLHWHVRCPITVSKKRVVRSWVTRRVRLALVEELKDRGYNDRGEVLDDERAGGKGLGVAVAISLVEKALTTPFDEIRSHCRQLVQKIIDAGSKQSGKSHRARNPDTGSY